MADNTSNNIPQRPIGPNGKPLLKKVKRPVKKLVKRPLSPVMPKNPAEPQVSQRPVQQAPRQVQQPQRPPVMPHTTSNNASRPQQQQPRSQQPALQRSVSQQTKPQNPIEKPSSKPVQNDIDINFDDMDDIKNIIADMAAHPEPVQNNEPEVKNLPDRLSSKQNVNKEPPAFVSDSDLDDDAEESRLLIQDGMFSKRFCRLPLLRPLSSALHWLNYFSPLKKLSITACKALWRIRKCLEDARGAALPKRHRAVFFTL